MHVIARPVKDFVYSSKIHEFPVDIEIMADVPTEISHPVCVTGALLTKFGDDDASFGYSMRVFPRTSSSIVLTPEKALQLCIDVFEHDDDFSDFVSGKYQCEIKVLVEVRNEIKNQMLDLWGSFLIDVS